MITIETTPLEKTSNEVQTKNINNSDVEILLEASNEKIAELQLLLNSKEKELNEFKNIPVPSTEQIVRKALNEDGRIHESVLKYILKLNDLESQFSISSLNLKRVFLGDGFYQVIS